MATGIFDKLISPMTSTTIIATIVFVITNSITIINTSLDDTCPSPCIRPTCLSGVLYCSSQGLTRLPKQITKNINQIIISNQRFINSHDSLSNSVVLSSSNFTLYSPPYAKIAKLKLINCSISGYHRGAFSSLHNLVFLDLAFNDIRHLTPDGFFGLRLKLLRLDSNEGLTLHRHSFRGLILRSLSLKNCQITHLTPEQFKPIKDHLEQLLLTNNKLRTLDAGFNSLFKNLIVLQLDNNSLICDCRLNWFSDFIHVKIVQSENQLKQNSTRSSNYITSLAKLICANQNQYVHMYRCVPPVISLIDVYVINSKIIKLTCRSKNDNIEADSNINWQLVNSNNPDKYIVKTEIRNHESVAIVTRRDMNPPIDTIDNGDSVVFKCFVKNRNGNSSIIFQILWPPLYSVYDSSNFDQSYPTTNQNLPIPNNSSFNLSIDTKRFTLLEMIGSIIATFTVTMLIFLIVYRHINPQKRPFPSPSSPPCYSTQPPHKYTTGHLPTSLCRYTRGQPFTNLNLDQDHMTLPPLPPLPPPSEPPQNTGFGASKLAPSHQNIRHHQNTLPNYRHY